jgi:general secretion pathway protein D
VGAAGALSLLEGVLAQNNARMVYSDGRYNIVTADQAMVSGVVPRTGSTALARGFESRVVPLRFVSATEMEKILKPYARPNAIVSVDGARNMLTIAGTRAELDNYLRTIQVFDVDWMASMSVGVYPLQSGRASDVVQDLERVFGEQGKSPTAGMFRFMPLDSSNAVMVITSQPKYLDDIQQWIDRIEGGSGDGRLFSYELKYIKARDLADRLAEVFGGGNGNGSNESPSLMPGVGTTEISDGRHRRQVRHLERRGQHRPGRWRQPAEPTAAAMARSPSRWKGPRSACPRWKTPTRCWCAPVHRSGSRSAK